MEAQTLKEVETELQKEKCKSSTQTVYSKTEKKTGTTTVAKVCTAYRNAAWGPRRAKQRQHSQWLSLPSATTSAHH